MERDCSNCLYRDECEMLLNYNIECGLDNWEPDDNYIYPDEEMNDIEW